MEDNAFHMITFLTEHQFLRATCCLGTNGHMLYIRIYLVPTDFLDLEGRLRHRSDSVLKEAGRWLRILLPRIVQDEAPWNADELDLNNIRKYFLPRDIDNRTLAELYTDLPSSVPNSVFSAKLGDEIAGLRSTLYDYQRQSVAVMMEKEMSDDELDNPLFIPISGMDGCKNFYFHPSTFTVRLECPKVQPRCKGGILCEELGTGKTVMILALVLATIDQLSRPACENSDPIMSTLAYRAFSAAQVPPLVEILLHRIRTSDGTIERLGRHEERIKSSRIWPLLQANVPFYHQYPMHALPSRSKDPEFPRAIFLTTATLVVVPLNLLGQWEREIIKHCHCTVRYLIIGKGTEMPTVAALISKYDIIVMADSRFQRESAKNQVAKLHKVKPCVCPSFPESRVPNCHCPSDSTVSSLLQVRWKRLVVDEGHTSGNFATASSYFVRQLNTERRWIVTGTPTPNILGLSFGHLESPSNCSMTDLSHATPDLDVPTTDGDLGKLGRIWGKSDYVNLRKIGIMISDFLAVPPFSLHPKLFFNEVSQPLCDHNGPCIGAIKVLTQVMDMVMVRHQIKDIESDVVMPPMHHTSIYMDLDPYAVKSYNAMQASIAINAIDSECTGPDYLFHPKNVKSLQTAIDNLSQGMFWLTSDTLFNVKNICHEAPKYLAHASERKIPDHDMEILKKALAHVEVAATDPLWCTMQLHSGKNIPSGVTGVGISLSTKLNFILSEVLKYSKNEKIIIFSNSPLSLSYIAEALKQIEIQYLLYTTAVSPLQREQFVMTFQSSETFHVFLMELKLSARGLNLVSASRVIFCEPVWHPDVEMQAIKRVHRIGQDKPVTVKTLAIRNTAEEVIISRRRLLKGSSTVPKMLAEAGMRHFIENPRFLDEVRLVQPTNSTPQIQTPLPTLGLGDTREQHFASESTSRTLEYSPVPAQSSSTIPVDMRYQPDGNVERPSKRPRIAMVRFAD